MTAISAGLQTVGLLPAGAAVSPPAGAADGADLLPLVVQAWSARAETATGRAADHARRTVDRLMAHQQRGTRLTWGVPGTPSERWDGWLGPRLAWWPQGIPAGRRLGVVSSRLGQEPERHKAWFSVLRTVCLTVDAARDLVVTAADTTTARFVQRCGELFGLRVLRLEVADRESADPRSWGRKLLAEAAPVNPGIAVRLSPPLGPRPADEAAPSAAAGPAPDRAVVAVSDRLVVLHVHRHGNIERLVDRRLNDTAFPPASVFLALGDDLVPKELAAAWMARGAVGWLVRNRRDLEDAAGMPWDTADPAERHPAAIGRAIPAADGAYLTHCTRRRCGPWPEESEQHFLDDLILDRSGADHSALAALCRIVQTRRLIATAEMVRGGTPVVSFTAVPLAQLPDLHAYRSHLGRWDFEPYGISLRREWLTARGARPVRYGAPALWEALAPEERPFFQRAQSHTAGGAVLDWTAEQEWRHAGDVDLSAVPRDAAFLFVPTEIAAQRLARMSPWPIVIAPFAASPRTRA